jgi:stage II sporulation protein R
MKLKKWELALIAALLFTFILGAGLRREQTDLSEKLIRLHVVANSDSEADQALKLKVRDGILKEVGRLLEGVTDRGEAVRLIEENLDTVTAGARDVVLQNGYGYEVTATIAVEAFPTREYETFSLPAGEYTSLRVVIGEGGGHNWWCVIFPPLCLSVRFGREDIFEQPDARGDPAYYGDGPEYVLKFKALELIEKLRSCSDFEGGIE